MAIKGKSNKEKLESSARGVKDGWHLKKITGQMMFSSVGIV